MKSAGSVAGTPGVSGPRHSLTGAMPEFQAVRGTFAKWPAWRASQAMESTSVIVPLARS
jgi:hypothetical protein